MSFSVTNLTSFSFTLLALITTSFPSFLTQSVVTEVNDACESVFAQASKAELIELLYSANSFDLVVLS